MPGFSIAALVFTVALLVVTAYAFLGSAPLLVLKHDTPLDSRFVRNFFSHSYRVVTWVAGATAASYALAGRPVLATGAAALAMTAVGLQRTVIPRMDAWRARIEPDGPAAIARFRRVHVAAILLSLAQLALVVGALVALSMMNRTQPL